MKTLITVFLLTFISNYSYASIETVTQASTFRHISNPAGSMSVVPSIPTVLPKAGQAWPHLVHLGDPNYFKNCADESMISDGAGAKINHIHCFGSPQVDVVDGGVNLTGYPKQATQLMADGTIK